MAAGRRWIAVAHDLLAARQFPRTPDANDCTYCPFTPVCGPDAPARAQARLADVSGPVADFLEIKGHGG